MEDNFIFYSKEEIEKIIKSQTKLVYVDNGMDEIAIRVKDLPDFIVDFSNKTGHKINLKIYDYHRPSMTPIATTIGSYLGKCEPKFREEIIDRLMEVQTGMKKLKKYKIIDERLLEEVTNKLKEKKVLLEYGDIIECNGHFIEIDDTNPDNYKETLVQIFNTKEDYDSKNYNEIVSLNTINLEKNIKNYIQSNYQNKDNSKLDSKEYIAFILGYDLLNKYFSNSKTPECDIVYEFCDKLSNKFVNTEYYKNSHISLYEALEKWVEANKSSIKKDFELLLSGNSLQTRKNPNEIDSR